MKLIDFIINKKSVSTVMCLEVLTHYKYDNLKITTIS